MYRPRISRIDTDLVCKEKELSIKSFTTTGDVRAVVRTGTEAVRGVFVVWACNDATAIAGLPKYIIIGSGIVAVLMIMTE